MEENKNSTLSCYSSLKSLAGLVLSVFPHNDLIACLTYQRNEFNILMFPKKKIPKIKRWNSNNVFLILMFDEKCV